MAADDGIYDVPATGGSLRQLTTVDPAWSQGIRFPELLPGGGALLYNAFASDTPSEGVVVVESLDTGERHLVVEGGSDPRYVASGHVLFARRGTLMAVPFDAVRLEVTGAPVVVVEDVMHGERGGNTGLNVGAAQFSVSRSGSLAFVPGGIYPESHRPLIWVDLTGGVDTVPQRPNTYWHPRVSPDGGRLTYAAGPPGDISIWVSDIGLEVPVRLTSVDDIAHPVWSPDGTQLAFGSTADGLFVMAADGSGEPKRVTDGDAAEIPSSWSSEGVLAFVQEGVESLDIMTLAMDGESEPVPFFASSFSDAWPAFSPDGRWLAYASNDTGRSEVYVRPFPEGEPAHRVSTSGGGAPVWSPDGRQLFYRRGEPRSIMVVDVQTEPSFAGTRPRTLFERPFGQTYPARNYDVAPDGRRFVMVTQPDQFEAQPVTRLNIVLNWVEELNRLVPTDR